MGPILVDVTRTVSRAFKPVPTGIDRVERAYIDHFLTLPETQFVCVFGRKASVFDQSGMQALLARIEEIYPFPDGKIHLPWKRSETRARNNLVAAHALGEGNNWHEVVPDGSAGGRYINVGHTNLDAPWLQTLKTQHYRTIAMIHDMIPLDTPRFQTPASVKRFEDRARNVARYCDTVIANSQATADRVVIWFSNWGRTCAPVVIPLGIAHPPNVVPTQYSDPYFIMLGTIEPRKNHQLVLDAWSHIPQDTRPILRIVGKRGWANKQVFKTLDRSPMVGRWIFEHGAVDDAETTSLLAGAKGLLFPSLAEGFGLPILEAVQLGVPVIANRLPVLEEIAGNSLLYMDSQDAKVWSTIITRIANSSRAEPNTSDFRKIDIPRWGAHFQQVMKLIR